MCGIFGMAFQNGHNMNDSEEVRCILDTLFIESEVRGKDASGVAFISLEKAVVVKHQITATELIETNLYKKAAERCLHMKAATSNTTFGFGSPIIILGHTRYKTKGTPKNHHNNHPIVSNKVIGVHNGIIDNDDILFGRFTKQFPAFVRKAEVDSEIIFRLLDHYICTAKLNTTKAVKLSTRLLGGSYACAAVNTKTPHMLWLFRSAMPIEIQHYPMRGLVIFASSSRFIDSAVDGIISEKSINTNLGINSCVGINLYQNRQTAFDIPEGPSRYQQNQQNWAY